ncbi:hypothetical protein BBJ28_00012467 [Nothophytophthora sp. Chile5]|nr:hypothetical protein BBJ28_00012467 [Nothophytophthora sp. Chile5]
MVTPMGIIDFVTIVPTLVTFFLTLAHLDGVLPLLRIARIFRMLAVLRLYRVVQSYRGFDYQLGVLVFLILALIFVAAGVFQILEESYYSDQALDPLEFHQAMYFVFVTMSTVGYGDISPKTTAGQFFVMLIIVVIVTVIPRQVTRLMELSALQHDYMHSYSVRRRSVHNGGHVVVTGQVRLESVAEFLKEFYRPRQGRVNMDVVFLADTVPSAGLQALLRNVRYRRRTTYLKGNLLLDRDAKRAHVAQAAAVFILAAKNDPKRAEATDALSILQALAIDKFRFRALLQHQEEQTRLGSSDGDERLEAEDQRRLERSSRRPIRCFIEILSPQRTRGLRTITGVEVALNTTRLRTAILARSIVCPGATALLLNLIYSPTERHVAQGRHSRTPWVAEYASGLQNLLFPAVLPAFFDGLLFHVMMIALYDRSAVQRGGKRICLSPFGERLEQQYVGRGSLLGRWRCSLSFCSLSLSLSVSDLVFLIAPSASVAKHAVDSLEERDREFESEQFAPFDSNSSRVLPPPPATATTVATAVPGGGEKPMPVLVFSSDTVLDRQSFQNDRRPSLDLDENVDEPAFYLSSASPSSSDSEEELYNEAKIADSASTATASSSPALQTPRRPNMAQNSSSGSLRRLNSTLDVDVRRRLHGHILICGPFVQGHQLACYLEELYAREGPPASAAGASGHRPAIILLVKTAPSDEDFANVPHALPPNVFVERGASQNVEDLLRVRAYEASSVLIVPSSWEGGVDESSEVMDEHLQDYQVIMSTLSLRTMQMLHHEHLRQKEVAVAGPLSARHSRGEMTRDTAPTLGCSVVKSHESTKYFAYKSRGGGLHHFHLDDSDGEDSGASPLLMKEISQNPHDEYHDEHLHIHHERHKPLGLLGWKLAVEARRRRARAEAERLLPPSFTPAYAAGEVFVDCVLDTLLCQSFFNPYAVDLIRALAGDYYAAPSKESNATRDDPVTFKASMMRYFSTVALASNEAVEGSKDKPKEAGGGCEYPVLRMATLSPELEGQSFAEVFSRALSQQVLVLGVYRRAEAAGRGNVLPYVVTCPESPTGCRVEHGDQLHVLTKRPAPVCLR